ncbi:AAA family ATPase [Agaribacterium sp. ZY112]|uniref:AAA family ATPase n=1 Tax=Agaribacterium sp. ZY112 TaxID=3233574 RepID=UPI0035259657
MDNNDLALLLKGRVPLIALESYDEQRAVELVSSHARDLGMAAWKWTLTDGIGPLGFGLELSDASQYCEPEAALRHLKGLSGPLLIVLCDLHPFLDDAKVIRLLKDMALRFDAQRQKLVLLSHRLSLPEELVRLSVKSAIALPDDDEIRSLLRLEAKRWQEQNRGLRVKTDKASLDALIANLRGLPHEDVRRLAWGAIADDGAITESDVPKLNKAKFALMDMQGVLHYEYHTEALASVAGFEGLKRWLKQREPALMDVDLEPPKGVLLFGVQGGGKSLAAKAIAGMWKLPLLRLDMAALYNKYIGETERNLRAALALADTMQPCVLWIDEIEKGLAEDGDSGVAQRILGTLLTWMAERKSRVILVATSNDISVLPPELMRKGRFDEVFFVDLPEQETRKHIFTIHMQKRDIHCEGFDLNSLAAMSEGFTGAEIEQAVVAACYQARADECQLEQLYLQRALTQTRPLSVLQAEKLHALRAWAKERSVPA